ncbi:hypothetical protein [Streptomyces sp. RKAG293]|uniref:hypothetical protein n=1 Tax=Streptomyces sp. RKAG293 TaxID=2893403 RepID=UPI00203469A3|nr:hypothetical protein [Streptomyces sp. RKAG293]MCM2422609.1 hypothetical protein [Streptomyces sp. RKAG293]
MTTTRYSLDRARALLRQASWGPGDVEAAVLVHDLLEEAAPEAAAPEARQLRSRLLLQPPERLDAVGGPLATFRRAYFTDSFLDVPPGALKLMRSLAYLTLIRYGQFATGDRSFLDTAIGHARCCRAVWGQAAESDRRAFGDTIDHVAFALAAALSTRYDQDRELEVLRQAQPGLPDVTEALSVLDEVVTRHRSRPLPPDPAVLAQAAAIRGRLLLYRFEGGWEDLDGVEMDRAVDDLTGANAAVTAQDPGSDATRLGGKALLAGLLLSRRRPGDPRRAEQLLTEVLGAPGAIDPVFFAGVRLSMATAQMLIAEQEGTPEALRRAREAYARAGAAGLRAQPKVAWDAATQHAGWARSRGRALEAARAYAEAFRVIPLLIAAQLTREAKELMLSLAADALSYCARELIRSQDPEDWTEAVLALEGARSVLLREAMDSPGPRAVLGPSETADASAALDYLAELLSEAAELRAEELSGIEASSDLRLRMARCRQEIELAATRTGQHVPEWTAPSWQQVVSSAAVPLVYLVAAPSGGGALVVRGGEGPEAVRPVPVDLPDLTRGAVLELLAVLRKAEELEDDQVSPEYGMTWDQLSQRVVQELWDRGMRAVSEALGPCDRAVLLPGGLLGMLPLHAAGMCSGEDSSRWWFLLERTVLSYAPHARARQAAAAAWSPPKNILLAYPAAQGDPGDPDQPVVNADAEMAAVKACCAGRLAVTTLLPEQVCRKTLLHSGFRGPTWCTSRATPAPCPMIRWRAH